MTPEDQDTYQEPVSPTRAAPMPPEVFPNQPASGFACLHPQPSPQLTRQGEGEREGDC
jgi:hypothetical protein